MYLGIRACYEELKSLDGRRLLVLVTDGRDNGVPRAESLLAGVKVDNIGVLTVGIGNKLSKFYLKKMASSPDAFVRAPNFYVLDTFVDPLTRMMCKIADDMGSPPQLDSCAAMEKKCELTAGKKKTKGVPMFKLRSNKPLFGRNIVRHKLGIKVGDVKVSNVWAQRINDQGNIFNLPSIWFMTTSLNSPFKVNFISPGDVEEENLFGKCIKLSFLVDRPGSFVKQCLVFRIAMDESKKLANY